MSLDRPQFEIFRDVDSEWRWRLRAINGEILATSEAYTRQSDVKRGIDDARRATQIANTKTMA